MENSSIEQSPEIGREIVRIVLINSTILKIYFKDGTYVSIWDDCRFFCERRYMSTEDDLSNFLGAKLLGWKVKNGPTSYLKGRHDIEFLEVKTSLGSFTVANHNEHNGSYVGFDLRSKFSMR